jgi:2-dehydro-3-deoxyglucarate aldolase
MTNIVKQKLRSGKVTLGAWVMIGHPASGELQAACGFDWVAVDTEHTSVGFETLESIFRAIELKGSVPFVRLPGHDPITLKRCLDIGARGLIVPMVNTAVQAHEIVQAAKFPPEGVRGAAFCRAAAYGESFKPYYDGHNEDVVVVAMIEHIDAVESIREIVDVEGIDALFIGPYDLSSSMGIVGEFDNPKFEQALERVRLAAKRAKLPVGLHVVPPDIEQIRKRAAEGYQFIACSIDTQMILALGKQMARSLD